MKPFPTLQNLEELMLYSTSNSTLVWSILEPSSIASRVRSRYFNSRIGVYILEAYLPLATILNVISTANLSNLGLWSSS